jgi:SAM-dependent methyltransferase
VTCIELGPRLAEEARRNLAVEIHVGSFEEWEGAPETFDLVFAATSWHWIDPGVRFRKAHDLLRPGGSLAFWSATHAFPPGFDPFFTEIQEVYDALGEGYPDGWPPPPPDETPDECEAIRASGLFAEAQVRRYLWMRAYTADEYVALLDTFSGHLSMEDRKRARLYAEIRRRLALRDDPRVLRHWQAILHVARSIDR